MTSAALGALLVTLWLEVPIVALCFPGQRWRMGLVALFANAGTNLLLNVWLPRWSVLHGQYLLPGEALAVVLEALAYTLASRPRELGRALAVSAFSNAVSFEFGGALFAFARRCAGTLFR
jgi:hypothetical protein